MIIWIEGTYEIEKLLYQKKFQKLKSDFELLYFDKYFVVY